MRIAYQYKFLLSPYTFRVDIRAKDSLYPQSDSPDISIDIIEVLVDDNEVELESVPEYVVSRLYALANEDALLQYDGAIAAVEDREEF